MGGMSVVERLEAASLPEPNSGCQLWTNWRNNKGYGMLSIGNRDQLAHRVAYELAHGSIPVGLNVCHRCDNPACIRLDHLFLGTQQDNLQDAAKKNRMRNGKEDRDRCPRGHAYDVENTYWRRDRAGHRECRACHKIAALQLHGRT